jgi:hypothetical protein
MHELVKKNHLLKGIVAFGQHMPDKAVCREELGDALKRHQVASMDTRVDLPAREEMIRIFTASTLPFIGFGFLDNLIMVCAPSCICMHAAHERLCRVIVLLSR